jgi:hypothetical protein
MGSHQSGSVGARKQVEPRFCAGGDITSFPLISALALTPNEGRETPNATLDVI